MENNLSREFSEFQSGIMEIQSRFAAKNRGLRAETGADPDQAEERLKQGLPWLEAEALKPDENFLGMVFEEILAMVKKHEAAGEEELRKLDDLRQGGGIELAELVRKIASGDAEYFKKTSAATGLAPELLVFFAENLARIFLSAQAEGLPGKYSAAWLRGSCPVCGNEPRMAKLERQQGKRILACSLCDTLWVFRRVECPYCGNSNPRDLRFFQIKGESPYRVDVCEKCKRYIKTVDERKMEGDAILRTE
ncbi:MAG: formate dehydrogenase accessory protein FdhE, partial [Proteobacteria bacterium]|nr:formate dehydrogenase accessory protein FdhE [Pseudomonadota bacterium]